MLAETGSVVVCAWDVSDFGGRRYWLNRGVCGGGLE